MSKRSSYAVALDIGGSHVSAALVDLAFHEILPGTLTRAKSDPESEAAVIIDTWAQAALRTLKVEQPSAGAIAAVGIAMPGPFDYASGVSLLEHKYATLYGLNIIRLLGERWQGTPLQSAAVRMANDAHLFTLGEWWAGVAQECEGVIGLTLGTGLGCGFVRDGRIVASGEGVPEGGEIWNTPYLDGTAEDYASGRAIAESYRHSTGQVLPVDEIARRAMSNDSSAREAFVQMGRHLVGILSPYVAAFRPECLVVGGNISRAWALFGGQLQSAWETVTCSPSQRLEEAALLGAAVYAADRR